MKGFLRTKTAAVLLSVLCTLLWGTAFPFIKLGYAAFEVADGDVGAMLLFAGCRFFLAGLMVLPVIAFQRARVLPQKGDVLPIAVLGLVLTAGQYFFTYIGLGFTSGANTSIITACASFLTVLAAPFFFRSDRLGALKIIGCVLGFFGVLVMNRGGSVSGETLFGDSMIFISTVCAAAGNLLSKKAAAGRNPLLVTAWQLPRHCDTAVARVRLGGGVQRMDGAAQVPPGKQNLGLYAADSRVRNRAFGSAARRIGL